MPTHYDVKLLSGNSAVSASDVNASIYSAGGASFSKSVFIGGNLAFNSVQCSAPCTVISDSSATLNEHFIVECNNTANTNIFLPTTVLHPGRVYHIIKTSNNNMIVMINTNNGSEYINNNSTIRVDLNSQFDRITLMSNGVSRWYTI